MPKGKQVMKVSVNEFFAGRDSLLFGLSLCFPPHQLLNYTFIHSIVLCGVVACKTVFDTYNEKWKKMSVIKERKTEAEVS